METLTISHKMYCIFDNKEIDIAAAEKSKF